MEHHGSESYYVLGEGLLTESGGGRARALSPEVEAQTAPFRFSRMGPSGAGHQVGEKTRRLLAQAMTKVQANRGSRIPSGFTYLGQFIDHDLTADKTTVTFGEAGHAFFCDQRADYRPNAAAEAWALTIAFLARTVGIAAPRT